MAESFMNRFKDERPKEWLTITVIHRLDDVDNIYLEKAAADPTWETMWLDSAERVLQSATESFASFEKQVEKYGGPERIELIG